MDTTLLRHQESCHRTLAQMLLVVADLAIDNHIDRDCHEP